MTEASSIAVAKALNRCAIARCAGSPTARTSPGVRIVDSVRVALS